MWQHAEEVTSHSVSVVPTDVYIVTLMKGVISYNGFWEKIVPCKLISGQGCKPWFSSLRGHQKKQGCV